MIVITGTPGTGKTVLADALGEELGLSVIYVNELVKDEKLFTGREKGSLLVDLERLKRKLRGFVGIVEGHVLCELSLECELVLVLRTSPQELRKRLARKGFEEEKIKENVEAEALDYCSVKALQNYGKEDKVFDVDTTEKTVEETVQRVLEIKENKKGDRGDRVDWTDYFWE